MSYRKFKADYLFDGFKMLSGEQVLVCEKNGTIEAILDEKEAGGDIEILSGILSPGFVNCHCHLELSHLKGLIPEKQGLVDFVFSVVRERFVSEEIIRAAMAAAESEMRTGGIVAVGDICNTGDTLELKSGNRLAYYHFIELAGWLPELAIPRFENGKKLYHLFKEICRDEKHVSLNPHSPYSVSENLWQYLEDGFPEKTVTIHSQETEGENEFFISGEGDLNRMYALMKMDSSHYKIPGTRSVPYYLPKLKSAKNLLLVHNTYMPKEDIDLAKQFSENLFFCFCPNANLYIENRLPDIPSFIKQEVNGVLGTDSLASNHQLSILEEMKTIKKVFPSTPTPLLLKWATSNGAKALQFEDQLGDFTKSKKPGIVLIENCDGREIGSGTVCGRLL